MRKINDLVSIQSDHILVDKVMIKPTIRDSVLCFDITCEEIKSGCDFSFSTNCIIDAFEKLINLLDIFQSENDIESLSKKVYENFTLTDRVTFKILNNERYNEFVEFGSIKDGNNKMLFIKAIFEISGDAFWQIADTCVCNSLAEAILFFDKKEFEYKNLIERLKNC